MDYDSVLKLLAQVDGFVAVAVAHHVSGIALAVHGNEEAFDMPLAVASMAQLFSVSQRMIEDSPQEVVEESIVMTTHHYHFVRPLGQDTPHFVYLVADRRQANLAMVRIQMARVHHTS